MTCEISGKHKRRNKILQHPIGPEERKCADAVEAAALEDRVGEVFDAMVVDKRENGEAVVQIADPAVIANAAGQAELGTWVKVRLAEATVSTGTVRFEVTP